MDSSAARPQPAPFPTAGLPPPAWLAAASEGKAASAGPYTETSIIRHGKDFINSLITIPNTHHNVGASNNNAKFSTSWTGNGLQGAGYCIYEFQIDGWDRICEVHYGWDDPPDNIGDAWIALGHIESNSWDWFKCNETGGFVVASFEPYKWIASGGSMYAAVVVADSGVSSLRYMRLGPSPTRAKLTVTPSSGVVPFDAALHAGGSSVPELPVTEHEWDLDGDGTYETITATDPTALASKKETDPSTVRLRVTNEYGEQSSASQQLSGSSPWHHSWGLSENDRGFDVAATPDAIYVAGSTISPVDSDTDALLLCYSLDGQFRWARSWGGSNSDTYVAVAALDSGEVYAAGWTFSFGAGTDDALLQRWDTDGNLIWSRTWGGPDSDNINDLDFWGSRLFACGEGSFTGDLHSNCVLLEFNPDGDFVWARSFGSPENDAATAMDVVYNFLLTQLRIHITGITNAYETNNLKDALYFQASDNGTILTARYWDHPGLSDVGKAISAGGLFGNEVYIAGSTNFNSSYAGGMILEVNGMPPLAKLWKGDLAAVFNAVYQDGEDLVLTGSQYGFASDGDFAVLRMSKSGAASGVRLFAGSSNYHEYCQASTKYPGSGLILVGEGLDIADCDWSATSATLSSLSGTWKNHAYATSTPAASIGQLLGDPATITGGLEDQGAGGSDAFAVVTNGI